MNQIHVQAVFFMKKWVAYCLLVCMALSFFGCRQADPKEAIVLLGEYMAKSDSLPAGEIYHAGLTEGEKGYFSEQMMERMYGEDADTRFFSLVEDYALYLSSFAEPCEIAVLRCYSQSDTDRLAEMCLERIEQLRISLTGTPYRTRADAATVHIEGRVVVMRLLP